MGFSAPNNANPGNHANGSFSQARSANAINPPNSPSDERKNDFMSLAESASQLSPPNNSGGNKVNFMPQAASPFVDGAKGAVAVDPGYAGNEMSPAVIRKGR